MIPARGALPVAALLCAAACATPQEVKQATVALDEGYRANLELMRQYRETVESTTRLQRTWARYVESRLLLSTAVALATSDPSDAALGRAPARLGADLMAWVNENRLAGLKARPPLSAGRVTLDALVRNLPALAGHVRRKVEADLAQEVAPPAVPFEEYARRVAVLRNANAAVRAYLGADVTVQADDVKAIAEGIERLGGSR